MPGEADPSEHQVVQAGTTRSARVESLRAIAALGVLVGHVWLYVHLYRLTGASYLGRVLATGGLGVQLFFCLSGYLIFRPFARRYFAAGGPIGLRTYALNRALRIVPLYLVAVIALLLTTQHGGTAEQWWRFLTFSESFSTTTAQTVDPPLWSVVVEIHFYVLLPVLAWALARAAGGRRLPAAALLLLIGAMSLLLQESHPVPAVVWNYSLPDTFYGFVPGMLLALLQIEWEQRRPRWCRGAAGAGDAWMLAGIGIWLVIAWRPSVAVSLTAPASFLTLAAVVLPLRHGRLVRVLDLRVLAVLGVISYSIYVWHIPILDGLYTVRGLASSVPRLLVVELGCALAVAAVSYLVVERPALRLRRTWADPNVRAAAHSASAPDPAASATEGAPATAAADPA